jgi:hypothetical protein
MKLTALAKLSTAIAIGAAVVLATGITTVSAQDPTKQMSTAHDVGAGTFEASEDFVFKHTGTRDSFMGTLTRKSDGFTITFDVGFMAGVHMSDARKDKCTFYRRHSIGGIPASTGIEQIADIQRITTTVDYDTKTQRPPANFWADIRKDSDIAEFMLIVSTYKSKSADRKTA